MGALAGIKIVEFAGLGPGPMACMLLADMGASIVRIERKDEQGAGYDDPVMRSRDALALDLKNPEDVAQAMELVARADALVEGFRPGVMEGLGLGPDVCLARHPALVYGRMTGWGQTGMLSKTAGHDINYIALSGVLDRIGPAGEAPMVPLNLVGDYGGGALYLALGIVSGVLHARVSGQGQVLDVAMVDGAASLMAKQYGLFAAGLVTARRGENTLDGGAPFYGVYRCADGGYVAVGAIEPKFFALLLRGLSLDAADVPAQHDRERWPELRRIFAAVFATRTRDDWAAHFAGSDACVTPVLSLAEAPLHPHMVERGIFVPVGNAMQPGPAPRFSAAPSAARPAGRVGFEQVLRAWDAIKT